MIVIVSDGELNLWINFHKAMPMKLGEMDEGKESGLQLTERSGASPCSSDRSGLQKLFGQGLHDARESPCSNHNMTLQHCLLHPNTLPFVSLRGMVHLFWCLFPSSEPCYYSSGCSIEQKRAEGVGLMTALLMAVLGGAAISILFKQLSLRLGLHWILSGLL